MLRVGIGDSLKKWATSKATELVTEQVQKRSGGASAPDPATPPATSDQAKTDAGEALLRAAFPQVGEWADQQKAATDQREKERLAEEDAEIAALPKAPVSIRVSGAITWQWTGELHVRRTEVGPKNLEPDDYENTDPYSKQTILSLELLPEATTRPGVGGRELWRWAIELPGWTGDATYDLIAIHEKRAAAGYDLDLDRNQLELGEDSDLWYYLDPDQGGSTVEVKGNRFSASLSMSGADGHVVAIAELTLP